MIYGTLHSLYIRSFVAGALLLADVPAVESQDLTVSGQIQWADRADQLHPLRGVPVQLIDAQTRQSLSPWVVTNDQGGYTATVELGAATSRTARIRVECRASFGSVRLSGTNQLFAFEPATDIPLTEGNSIIVDVAGVSSESNNQACSILDAIGNVHAFLGALGAPPVAAVNVAFADTKTAYSNGRLYLLEADRWDWDVILHEYGHHVSDHFNLDRSPGGPHDWRENLSLRLPKDQALRLAWGEAWPTYFAIVVQLARELAATGIPNVGDTRYQDTEDAEIDFDLATQDGAVSRGEDNEVAVMRILFDLDDSIEDPIDPIGLGSQHIWDALQAAKPKTLGDALFALWAKCALAETLKFGPILAQHRVGPELLAPANEQSTTSSPMLFHWAGNVTGLPGDQFTVKFYDSKLNLIHSSDAISESTYTPPSASWDRIRQALGTGEVLWLVESSNPKLPSTGPYISNVRRLKW